VRDLRSLLKDLHPRARDRRFQRRQSIGQGIGVRHLFSIDRHTARNGAVRTGRRQSMPSSSIDNWAGVSEPRRRSLAAR